MKNSINKLEQKKSPLPNKTESESESKKKVYEKPKVIYQAPLEAMAATCTGSGGKAQNVCDVGFS